MTGKRRTGSPEDRAHGRTKNACPEPRQGAVRPLELRRRRSRVPWIYVLYHHKRRERRRSPARPEPFAIPADEVDGAARDLPGGPLRNYGDASRASSSPPLMEGVRK